MKLVFFCFSATQLEPQNTEKRKWPPNELCDERNRFLSPCCFSKAFLVLSKVSLKIFEEFFRVKNVKSLYLMELFGDMKANAKETYLDVEKMRKQNIF